MPDHDAWNDEIRLPITMSDEQTPAEKARVSAADMARFQRNAPAALARRGKGYVAEAVLGSLEMAVMGATPIVGLVWFNWSAAEQLAFLLVGAWVGIACDLARLVFAGRGVQAFAQTHYDDWHVWTVVAALRSGREAPQSHLQARHEPWAGVFVDFAAGGIASIVLIAMLGASGLFGEAGLLQDRSVLVSAAVFAAYQAASAAWEIIRHRRAGADAGPVQAQPGARGAGLFVLMFVVLIAGDPETYGGVNARRVMLVVNGVIVLLGVLNAAAIVWLKQETVWLRDYLQTLPAAAVEPQARAKQRQKRKRRR
jgi:hypothetical protein